ncbi:sensor domain-containing diguanylate cyclase [Cryobacterium frigoriphilum]|uniref:Sensor domain-containing diguanylate cyclase n=1 Tax=Cryobacterium frigoriphilum TaxID=1259150 RepID=A0A4V3IRV9_9MICO|nr:GGDEF domain-containing protein [Cryobacterium frigoriphilum]TFD53943.1 sensor domain-containing diguanylate cyclase [Cryobacterium frigoriphilum]
MVVSARIGALIVVVVGALALVGWYVGLSRLTNLIPGFGAMRPTTALCLLLLAAAVLLLNRPIAAGVLGCLVAVLGTLTLLEYAFAASLGVATLLPGIDLGTVDLGGHSLIMAPGTAAALIFLGASVALIGYRRHTTLALMLSMVGLGISQIALVGFAYSVSSLYTVAGTTSMAPHTGASLLILSLAIMAQRPRDGLIGLLRDQGSAGTLLRGAFPFFLLVPFLVGWLRLWGEREGMYTTAFGTGMLVISMTVLGCGVSWLAALRLRELDHLRDASDEQLAEVNRTLESTVSERTRELAESAETLHALIRVAPVGFVQLDADGGLLAANDTWMSLSGMTVQESLGGGWAKAIHPDDVERVVRDWTACVEQGGSYEATLRFRRPDGEESWVQVSTTPLNGSEVDDSSQNFVITGHLASVTDITALRQIEARIEHLAFHDALTGLPNRILLLDRLDQALLNAGRHGRGVGVLFLDLDRFKIINDTLGHHVGDAVLSEVATRLSHGARSTDTVARIGGDEFVVVCPDVAGLDDVALIAAKISDLIRQPIDLPDLPDPHDLPDLPDLPDAGQLSPVTVSVGVSIGIAFGVGGDEPELLLREADRAMYLVKDPVRTPLAVLPERLDRSVL